MKYKILSGWLTDVEGQMNELDETYTVQQITTKPNKDWSEVLVTALLRSRSEEPNPEDGWCLDKTISGDRCALDAVRDGLCKRHWRYAKAKGLL